MTRWLAVLVSVLLGTSLLCGTALAQDEVSKPFAVKVGVFRPDSGTWRSDSTDYWVLTGIDYIFNVTPAGGECVGALEYGPGKHGNRLWSLQGIYRLREYTGEEYGRGTYYGAGFGVYFAKVEGADGTSDKVTRAGIPVVAGMDLTNNLFLEVKYNIIFGKAVGRRLSGFSAALGLRF